MTKHCPIIEDLLPMYHDGLLQDDTNKWVEKHLAHCDSCKQQSKWTAEPINKEPIDTPNKYDKVMAKAQLKLSIYQMLLIGFSFFLVIRSVVFEKDLSFVFSYTILGFLIYLFYKRYRYVFYISFFPSVLWLIGSILFDLTTSEFTFENETFIYGGTIFSSILFATLHLLFAFIGATVALFTLKLFEEDLE